MTPLLVRLAALIAVFASVFLGAQILLSATAGWREHGKAVNQRLALLRSGLDRARVASILRHNLPRLRSGAGPIERGLWHLQRMTAMAGVTMDPRMFLTLCVLAFLALGGVLLFLVWSTRFRVTGGVVELIVCVSAAITVALPLLVLAQLVNRRRKRMVEQFPLALDIFTRALRAGHPISAAIELLTQEVGDPLGSEFGLVSDELAYGANLNDALLSLADRWDLEDIRMFVVSLAIQSETGGNLAEILENLQQVIRERASLYRKVRALSSEGRMSGWMLCALPVLTFISMFLVNPGFYLDVAADPVFTYGFSTLLALYLIGIVIINRIIKIRI